MMSDQIFPRVPVNPRLEFGLSLDRVCEKGILHPGLRELILKAYLSASGHDRDGEESLKGSFKAPYVLEALKAGPRGQGRLADRISLKLKLESGKWIIASQTPAGAPLWLLRHFLGCLPQPLLSGSHWRVIAVACGAGSHLKSNNDGTEVSEKIATALEALPTENYLTLEALVLLIRDLSTVTWTNDSNLVTLHEEALEALSLYFTASIISRPYRPGLYTMVDKEHKSLLLFLSEHWLEVKEPCRHTGISHYHNTCVSRYEFVSLDSEVDRTMWQTIAPAEDNHDGIGLAKGIARKSNQKRSQTTKDKSDSNPAYEKVRTLKNEPRRIDVAVTSNTEDNEVQGGGLSTTVHTPKGVYFSLSNAEYIHTSTAAEEARSLVTENSSDTVKLLDTRFDCCYVRLKVPKIGEGLECLHLSKVLKDENRKNPRFDVQKLIGKYEREVIVCPGIQEALEYDGLHPEKEVTGKGEMKINGTQTFECEFCDDGLVVEVGKLQEKTNEVRASRSRVKILRISDTQELRPKKTVLAIDEIGSTNDFKFSKIRKRRALLPLTKSTALLIKNIASNEEIAYFPASQVSISDLIDLIPNGKVIVEVEQSIPPKEDPCTSNTDIAVKTLTNHFKDATKFEGKNTNSNPEDFVAELKHNFKQGRRRPSDAKLSSHITITDDSETMGSSDGFHIAKFRSEKGTEFWGSSVSSPTYELFQKTSSVATSSANSI